MISIARLVCLDMFTSTIRSTKVCLVNVGSPPQNQASRRAPALGCKLHSGIAPGGDCSLVLRLFVHLRNSSMLLCKRICPGQPLGGLPWQLPGDAAPDSDSERQPVCNYELDLHQKSLEKRISRCLVNPPTARNTVGLCVPVFISWHLEQNPSSYAVSLLLPALSLSGQNGDPPNSFDR